MKHTKEVIKIEKGWQSVFVVRLRYIALFRCDTLCAESSRAVTGRQSSHSGEGEDFLTSRPSFVYENGPNSEMNSRKIFPRVGNESSL